MRWNIELWVCLCIILSVSEWKAVAKWIQMSLEERIRSNGYPVELHAVTTEDDYILTAYRIPYGIQKPKEEDSNRSVVVLLHGMGGSPFNWVYIGKHSFSYYLADRGFDVWILTIRGDVGAFPKKHKKYDWNVDPEYWNFSLHEPAYYDLAANIDYITLHTNQSKVFFVGHSLGCPEFFALMSERPEYNNKIKIGVQWACAPITKRMEYMPVLLATSLMHLWRGVYNYLQMAEFLPQMRIFIPLFTLLCQDPLFKQGCMQGSGFVGGYKSVIQNDNFLEIVFNDFSRLSTRLLIHVGENVNDGDFKQYNWGPQKNMEVYGQKTPPHYNLSSCVAPVAFMYSPRDLICVKGDIYESMNSVSNVIMDYEVPFDKFIHIDFIISNNSTDLVYEPVCKLFRDYDQGKLPEKIGKRTIPEY